MKYRVWPLYKCTWKDKLKGMFISFTIQPSKWWYGVRKVDYYNAKRYGLGPFSIEIGYHDSSHGQ